MKVSEHFSIDEIKCHCGCGQKNIDEVLYDILESFRTYAGNLPMITHCVNRCKSHNEKIGGISNSMHIKGHAWDGHIEGMSINRLHSIALQAYKENILPGGLGLYQWGIHIDTGKKRKW